MKTLIAALILVASAIFFNGCATQTPATPAVPLDDIRAQIAPESRLLERGIGIPNAGERAPDFSFTLTDGSNVRLSDLQGKRVIVNFWATWCLPCREEMPLFEAAVAEGAGDLVVLAVNRNEAPAAIERYAAETGVTLTLIADIAGTIGDRYGVTSLPITYFINRDGTVSTRQFGAIAENVLRERIEALQ
jgi:thiol-disulfide isomerase/thioredoxin